jgi:hypothetical protein
MPTKTIAEKPLFMTVIQIFLGLALITISTHLALDSNRYLIVLNQNGLNQHHAFGILVCMSFIAGVFLIAQYVLSQDGGSTDEHFDQALTH